MSRVIVRAKPGRRVELSGSLILLANDRAPVQESQRPADYETIGPRVKGIEDEKSTTDYLPIPRPLGGY